MGCPGGGERTLTTNALPGRQGPPVEYFRLYDEKAGIAGLSDYLMRMIAFDHVCGLSDHGSNLIAMVIGGGLAIFGWVAFRGLP
ncbi:MAG TPA: hypothetical protein VN428_02030 [Bryobacteraceae bacterium]|nr:hypothetical protein [Bryobacteraceae bacterium]